VIDIPYGPHPRQALDIYLPDSPAMAPIVLCVHGGGWSVGDKEQYASVGERLAREGFMAVIANYRLSPDVQHPAHVEDVAQAVAWCYHHAAEYGADRERLCLLGHSTGAYLVALVALEQRFLAAHGVPATAIRRVVGVAGVAYDLDQSYAESPVGPFFSRVFGPECAGWEREAPLRYVTAAAPEFLLVHGLEDREAPPDTTKVFAGALERAGGAVQLLLLPDEGHISVMMAAAPQVVAFLQADYAETG